MGHYKFISSQFADGLCHGTIRFTRLYYYALQEHATKVPWIGDANEGHIVNKLPPAVITENTDSSNPYIAERIAAVEGGGKIVFEQGFEYRQYCPNYFIWCCSVGDLDSLSGRMMTSEYDCCISISDISKLERSIGAGTVRELGPMEEHFPEGVKGDLVSYTGHRHEVHNGPVRAPSPFIKDKSFESQNEYRIILQPSREDLNHWHILVDFDSDGVFSVVRQTPHLIGSPTINTFTKINAIDEIDQLITSICEQQHNTNYSSPMVNNSAFATLLWKLASAGIYHPMIIELMSQEEWFYYSLTYRLTLLRRAISTTSPTGDTGPSAVP